MARMERYGVQFLHAFSRAIIPKPKDWSDQAHVVGYWFLDSASNVENSSAMTMP
jgi:sterol 3beta-glucosyltransferase